MLGSIINGALTGRRKRSKKAKRYLTGGRGSFLNASTLLAVAGVAWGLYETTMKQSTVASSGSPVPPPAPPGGGPSAPPPLPVAGGSSAPASAGPSVPPPLPGVAPASAPPVPAAAAETSVAGAPIPGAVQRVIRLTVSASRADGTLTDAERSAILDHARGVGAEAVVEDELARPTPLARIVEGVADQATREELYTLAFALVRADETVTGAERIYLAQLAHALGLDAATAARLEATATSRLAGDDEDEA